MDYSQEEYEKAVAWLEEPMSYEQFEELLRERKRFVISDEEVEAYEEAVRENVIRAYRENDWRRKPPPVGKRFG